MPQDDPSQKIRRQNIQAWEEAAPIHWRHNQAWQLKAFGTPGFSCLKEVETEILLTLGVAGKDVAQVCCNNGRELISVKNMGAARCVGFDGAQGFLDQGVALAKAAGQDVEFHCCDANAIPTRYHNSFDLVIMTIGVLGWMPDIDLFIAGVAKLLRPGGAVFIHEHHPVLMMLEPGPAEAPVNWELSYFTKDPYVDDSGLDYYGGENYDATPNISFSHKMSDILMAMVNAGLTLEHFNERPDHISNVWWNVEQANIGVPMSYTLVVRKSA